MYSGFHSTAASARISMMSCVLTVSSGSRLGGIVVSTPGARWRSAGGAAHDERSLSRKRIGRMRARRSVYEPDVGRSRRLPLPMDAWISPAE